MHASFNSMWPSPNSNRRFLKFKVKRFEIGISDKHSISCSCKKLCTSSLLIPFVSTMASHWLQFRTKSCMSNAKIYGTPSDISIVRFLSTSLPTELMNMGHNIYRFLRLRVHHTAINVHSKFLFRMSWFGSNVWIVVDSRFVISKLQLGYLVIVFPYASEHLEQIIFFFILNRIVNLIQYTVLVVITKLLLFDLIISEIRFPRYCLKRFCLSLSSNLIFSPISLGKNLLNQHSGKSWCICWNCVSGFTIIYPTVVHVLIGILDPSFIVRPHLPTFWLLSIVLIVSFLVGHLMGLDGWRNVFTKVV